MKVNAKFLWVFSNIFFINAIAQAADLSVMSAGAVGPGVELVIRDYEKYSGQHVKIQFGTAPQLKERLASEQLFDVLIAPNSLVDEQMRQGKLLAGEHIYIGKVGAGVAVRNNLVAPVIGTLDELKKAVLAADRVIYNKASTGIYLDKLFAKLGISESIANKTIRYDDGESVLMHIAKGHGVEIGFGAVTEIKLLESKGLKYVGPLPAEVQNYTTYSAGVMAMAPKSEEAKEFLKKLNATGLDGSLRKVGIE